MSVNQNELRTHTPKTNIKHVWKLLFMVHTYVCVFVNRSIDDSVQCKCMCVYLVVLWFTNCVTLYEYDKEYWEKQAITTTIPKKAFITKATTTTM